MRGRVARFFPWVNAAKGSQGGENRQRDGEHREPGLMGCRSPSPADQTSWTPWAWSTDGMIVPRGRSAGWSSVAEEVARSGRRTACRAL